MGGRPDAAEIRGMPVHTRLAGNLSPGDVIRPPNDLPPPMSGGSGSKRSAAASDKKAALVVLVMTVPPSFHF
jgi:hypothetical protein